MARSYRKSPFRGWTTARSEKWFKRYCNASRRAAERAALANLDEPMGDPKMGVWGPKDGKTWCSEKEMRK